MKKLICLFILSSVLLAGCQNKSKEEIELEKATQRQEQLEKVYKQTLNDYEEMKDDFQKYNDAVDRLKKFK